MTIRYSYIHKDSNHPPSILRQLPTSINKRISTLSSDKQVFDDAVQTYQNALGQSNFSHKLEYMPQGIHKQRRNRQCKSFGSTLHSVRTSRGTLHAVLKYYIGTASNTFKERHRNHIKSFTHKKYSKETELSKHVWQLKQNKTDFTIKWSIIK